MSAVSIVIQKLLATSAVTDIVDTRIRADKIEEGVSLPAITVHLVGEMEDYTLSGSGGNPRARVSVNAMGSSAADVNSVANAVRTALKDVRGLIGSSAAVIMKEQSDVTLFEEKTGLHRRVSDYSVRHYPD